MVITTTANGRDVRGDRCSLDLKNLRPNSFTLAVLVVFALFTLHFGVCVDGLIVPISRLPCQRQWIFQQKLRNFCLELGYLCEENTNVRAKIQPPMSDRDHEKHDQQADGMLSQQVKEKKHNNPAGVLSHLREFLSLNKREIRRVKREAYLREYSRDAVQFLRDTLSVSEASIANQISRHPGALLLFTETRRQQVLAALQDFGFKPSQIKSLIKSNLLILYKDGIDCLPKRLTAFKHIYGLTRQEVIKLILSRPMLLGRSIARDEEIAENLMEKLVGVDREDGKDGSEVDKQKMNEDSYKLDKSMAALAGRKRIDVRNRRPTRNTADYNDDEEEIEEEANTTANFIVSHHPRRGEILSRWLRGNLWAIAQPEVFDQVWDLLIMDLDFTSIEARKIFQRFPNLVNKYTIHSFEERLEFFIEELHLSPPFQDIQTIIRRQPNLLTYSIDKRLRPNAEFLMECLEIENDIKKIKTLFRNHPSLLTVSPNWLRKQMRSVVAMLVTNGDEEKALIYLPVIDVDLGDADPERDSSNAVKSHRSRHHDRNRNREVNEEIDEYDDMDEDQDEDNSIGERGWKETNTESLTKFEREYRLSLLSKAQRYRAKESQSVIELEQQVQRQLEKQRRKQQQHVAVGPAADSFEHFLTTLIGMNSKQPSSSPSSTTFASSSSADITSTKKILQKLQSMDYADIVLLEQKKALLLERLKQQRQAWKEQQREESKERRRRVREWLKKKSEGESYKIDDDDDDEEEEEEDEFDNTVMEKDEQTDMNSKDRGRKMVAMLEADADVESVTGTETEIETEAMQEMGRHDIVSDDDQSIWKRSRHGNNIDRIQGSFNRSKDEESLYSVFEHFTPLEMFAEGKNEQYRQRANSKECLLDRMEAQDLDDNAMERDDDHYIDHGSTIHQQEDVFDSLKHDFTSFDLLHSTVSSSSSLSLSQFQSSHNMMHVRGLGEEEVRRAVIRVMRSRPLIQMTLEKALQVIRSVPFIISFRIDRSQRMLLSLAVTLGLSQDELGMLCVRCPRLFCNNVDKKLKNVLVELADIARNYLHSNQTSTSNSTIPSQNSSSECEYHLADRELNQETDRDIDAKLWSVWRNDQVRALVRYIVLKYHTVFGLSMETIRERGRLFLERLSHGESWETFPYYLRLKAIELEYKVQRRDKRRKEIDEAQEKVRMNNHLVRGKEKNKRSKNSSQSTHYPQSHQQQANSP